ncbi:hypothetical protein COCMIDRAFT_101272, partial [Bipolaris oryzae ATCC 44560]
VETHVCASDGRRPGSRVGTAGRRADSNAPSSALDGQHRENCVSKHLILFNSEFCRFPFIARIGTVLNMCTPCRWSVL